MHLMKTDPFSRNFLPELTVVQKLTNSSPSMKPEIHYSVQYPAISLYPNKLKSVNIITPYFFQIILCFPVGIFHLLFSTKILYPCLVFPMIYSFPFHS